MKQFTCSACGKKWYADDTESDAVMTCPYSSIQIRKKGEIEKVEDVAVTKQKYYN